MRLPSLSDWGHSNDRQGFVRRRARFSPLLKLMLIGVASGGCIVALYARSLANGEKPLSVDTVARAPAPSKQHPDIPLVQVLIARKTIEKGTPLQPSLFRVTQRARSAIPEGNVVHASSLAGSYAAVTIPALYPLVEDYVVDERAQRSILRKIPEGSRAVTIHTSVVNSVEGWARAGSKVDVQWVGRVNDRLYSKIVVQNAEVLSIERKLNSTQSVTEPDPATVTLLVSEADAERLTVVTGVGDLILHLRGSDDNGEAITSRGVLKDDDLFLRRIPSINDRLQGVARIPGSSDDKETWALLDGKWVKRSAIKP